MATVTTADVTRFLRDYANYNILLGAVEFTDQDVASAKRFAISEFNVMTPATAFDEANFPNEWLLLMGIACHLLQSEAFLQLRNQVSYSDGNIGPVGIDDKASAYIQIKNDIKAQWQTAARQLKTQQNMESAYDSLSSGYRFIRTGTRTS
jgi:hypothetical protein